MNPGIPDFCRDHRELVFHPPDDLCKVVKPPGSDLCARVFLLDRLKARAHGLGAGCAVVVERVVEIEHAAGQLAFKSSAVIAGINDDNFAFPLFPQETRRHLRHGGCTVDADMQEFNSVLCEQGNKADRMAGHIGHFRGNGFAASDIVDLIDDGEAIIERVGVKQFCVRCKWHGMRCNIAAAQALQKGLPVLLASVFQRFLEQPGACRPNETFRSVRIELIGD